MGDWLARNQVHIGDVRELAARLEPQSVQTIVTSPPYWNLRSYLDKDHPDKARELGGEATPDEFVANLVAVFAALRPALKDDGTMWINLGDSYASDSKWGGQTSGKHADGLIGTDYIGRNRHLTGLPHKSLVMIPHRVALALQADGWIVRMDCVWHKPSPMPEPVTDRPTKAHEYMFLISKLPDYFYDAFAVREPNAEGAIERFGKNPAHSQNRKYEGMAGKTVAGMETPVWRGDGRNRRSVWTIPAGKFPDAHYATFPPELVRPCILAGTSAAGECSQCGKAWIRLVERERGYSHDVPKLSELAKTGVSTNGTKGSTLSISGGSKGWAEIGSKVVATGWAPQCRCGAPTRPQVVCDPFGGSGTTASVAHELGRDWLLTDIDERAIGWTNGRLQAFPVGVLPGMA